MKQTRDQAGIVDEHEKADLLAGHVVGQLVKFIENLQKGGHRINSWTEGFRSGRNVRRNPAF
jgi:hypothetical protein